MLLPDCETEASVFADGSKKTVPVFERANVLGIGIHAINMQSAVDAINAAIQTNTKAYVCVTGVHGIMEAQRDRAFASILNSSFLVTPDGMPTVWVGRLQGFSHMSRVFGPDLMAEVCSDAVSKGSTHFLYGGASGVAEELRARLESSFPGIRVVGTYTPPYRPLTAVERGELIARFSDVRPDITWVGLSTPKQEKFMAEYLPDLDTKVMIGVGAAFDLHTGRMKDSPQWIKKAGLQWAHRLVQDPARLWKRYLTNNPVFVCKIALQLAGIKTYSFDT